MKLGPAIKRIKAYIQLTKPGIIRGNLFTAAGGFFLASNGSVNLTGLVIIMVAIALVIASGCVFNNYMDRQIDSRMARTKKRALVDGTITPRAALLYGSILGAAGFLLLAFGTNLLTLIVGVVGFVDYVILYGFVKRRSVHGTLVGGVSGAMPPVAGYLSVTNHVDVAAVLLFAILTLWQLPHFYAIGIYRLSDYKKAKVPILTVVRGVDAAKRQIVLYIIAVALSMPLLTFYGTTGKTYLVVTTLLSILWIRLGLKGFRVDDDSAWARKVFGFSLVVLLVFSILISLNWLLP